MDYKVILSDRFISDLAEIVAYLTKQAGSDTAARVGNKLLDRANSLAPNPPVGPLAKGRPGVRKVLRYSYKIFYEIDETQRVVEVLRVWHGRRGPSSLRLRES